MADKTVLEWTDAEKAKLNLELNTYSPPNDRTVYATWNKISSFMSEKRLKLAGGVQLAWRRKMMDSDDDTAWIVISRQEPYSKNVGISSEVSVADNALAVQVGIRLYVADSHKDKYQTSSHYYWVTHNYSSAPAPSTPSDPNVNIDEDKGKVIISQTISDQSVVSVKFLIYTEVGGVLSQNAIETNIMSVPATRVVTYEMNATSGYKYYAKAVWYNSQGGSSESSSSGSAEAQTIPSQITGLTVGAYSINPPAVIVSWNPDSAAARTNGYEIERATEERFLGTSQSTISSANASPDIISVEVGSTWYFRVRAKNQSGSTGAWSETKSVTMSLKPGPPTTWSLYSSYKIGDPILLYWTYNSRDGSKPTTSKVYWRLNGGELHTKTIEHSYPEEQTEFTFFWDITTDPTFNAQDGDKLTWYVTSYGIGSEESDPSIEREVSIYISPEVWVTFSPLIEQYPFDIDINCLPVSQHLVSGVITIQNVNTYETLNRYGEDVIVNAGSVIYSQVFDGYNGNHFVLSLDPSNIELETDEDYLVSVKIVMDSGLTADNSNQSGRFSTHFERFEYILDSGMVFNRKTYAAALTPSCVYMDEDGEATDELVPNFTISVYRVNTDGTMVPITTDLPNDGSVTVLDPHPSLDVPSYRIVGTDMATGFMYYINTIGESTNIKGIIIQWDESYRNYINGYSENPEEFGAAYTGMTLELPFNVKTMDSSDMDVEFVNYIGREDPVSYYGTQQGKQATWSCEFDKTNTNTLYMLRHLDNWKGDVYVRYQSGIGYWANVKVSYNEDYDNLVIPASFQISKVDSKRP